MPGVNFLAPECHSRYKSYPLFFIPCLREGSEVMSIWFRICMLRAKGSFHCDPRSGD